MFKVGQIIRVTFDKKVITATIIGIDTYLLETFSDTQKNWNSYTLISDAGGKFERFWVTDWKSDGWFVWTRHKKLANPKVKKIILDRSGIAKITFKGDRGASTPTAALAVYEISKGLFYSTERFAGSKTMYFQARKIRKPVIGK